VICSLLSVTFVASEFSILWISLLEYFFLHACSNIFYAYDKLCGVFTGLRVYVSCVLICVTLALMLDSS